MRFLRVRGGGDLAGPDGPNWLVGDDNFEQLFRFHLCQAPVELRGEDFFHLSFLALCEGFADAKNRTQFLFEGGAHLSIHDLIRLAKHRAPLAVT